MEVGLIIAMFCSSAFALNCLYNQRMKMTGALIVLNLCLTVALAYQFQQMEKVFYVLVACCVIGIAFFAAKFYAKKKYLEKKEGNKIPHEEEEE